jgi:hypothetical protein
MVDDTDHLYDMTEWFKTRWLQFHMSPGPFTGTPQSGMVPQISFTFGITNDTLHYVTPAHCPTHAAILEAWWYLIFLVLYSITAIIALANLLRSEVAVVVDGLLHRGR